MPLVIRTDTARPVPSPRTDEPWIWVCSRAIPATAIAESVLRGAYDCISLTSADARARLALRQRELELLSRAGAPDEAPGMIARSPASRQMLAQLTLAARTLQPVLLTGETGTGKELAARLIHARSSRGQGSFVPINCAAIPNELMEGELFGYAKGAFSGAVRRYDGLMSAGQGGTVFLDEIDDTPHALQVKLLRVLEDRVVSRLGENVPRKVDFRILAATNRDLRALIEEGAFGADLYERLAVISIRMPPLRERAEDIPPLIDHLVARFYQEEPSVRGRVRGVTSEALRTLQAYPWPGNIRELRNVVFAALAAKRAGEEILVSDLPRRLLRREESTGGAGAVSRAAVERAIDAGSFNLNSEIEALERAALESALSRTGGNAARAAQLLGAVGRGSARDPGGTVRAMMRRLRVR
jgi:DNA-binding NtrC family response regulator